MENVEIEIRLQIKNAKPLFAFLKKKAAFKGQKHQVDDYFVPAHRDFLSKKPIEEWLRLRESEGKFSINYKNWHYESDGKSHFADEYETVVEDVAQLRKIIEALNFKKIVTVDKVRQTYIFEDYEIAIDSVKDLGDFVEIEFKGETKNIDPKKITTEMVSFLKEVGRTGMSKNYQGYPFLLLFPKEAKFEEID